MATGLAVPGIGQSESDYQLTVGVRLDPGDKARLTAYAGRTGQAVRQVIIKAIRDYLDRHDTPDRGD